MKTEVKKNGLKYYVELSQGCQYFALEYRATKREANWMKDMLDKAIDKFKDEIRIGNNKYTVCSEYMHKHYLIFCHYSFCPTCGKQLSK